MLSSLAKMDRKSRKCPSPLPRCPDSCSQENLATDVTASLMLKGWGHETSGKGCFFAAAARLGAAHPGPDSMVSPFLVIFSFLPWASEPGCMTLVCTGACLCMSVCALTGMSCVHQTRLPRTGPSQVSPAPSAGLATLWQSPCLRSTQSPSQVCHSPPAACPPLCLPPGHRLLGAWLSWLSMGSRPGSRSVRACEPRRVNVFTELSLPPAPAAPK